LQTSIIPANIQTVLLRLLLTKVFRRHVDIGEKGSSDYAGADWQINMITRHKSASLLLIVLLLALSPSAYGAPVWQWSVPVSGGIDKAGPSRAFFWIPENCKKLRGVVFAQNNMEEEMILENPKFRAALSDLGFGEVWAAPAFDLLFNFSNGAGNTFNGMMTDLAAQSGYSELTYVPVIPVGHSAAASMPYYFGAWSPERTIACISVSGQWPYVRNSVFAPDIWGSRTIDYIPGLETMGEYESADTWANEGLYERQQHPLLPLSMAAGPAQSHFIAADAKIDYLILYIRKAVQYRLPQTWDGKSAPALIPMDPTRTGWLADRWRKDLPPIAVPAPIADYKGNPKDAFWYFDREMADATERYEAAYRGQKEQLVGYVQDGVISPQTNSHLQINLKFEPDADGITFHLGTAFLNTVPGASPRPATWTGLPVGTPIGHADGGGPIEIKRIVGPFVETAPGTFQVSLQKETIGVEKSFELVFAETQSGDSVYRPPVQQAHMFIPARNTKGAPQTITFPLISNVQVGAKSIELSATSDAKTPVAYYVREGPAVLSGSRLEFTPIPPGAKYPVAVTVFAWQYGHAAAPALQSAEPVGVTFYISKRGQSASAPHYVHLLTNSSN